MASAPVAWRTLSPRVLRDAEHLRGLALLSAAAGVAATLTAGITVLAAQIQRSLRAGDAGLEAVLVGAAIAAFVAGPAAGLAADRFGRMRTSALALVVLAIAGALVSASSSIAVLAVLVTVAGTAGATVATAHLAWIADAYPADVRGRALAAHGLAVPIAATLGATTVSALGWPAGMLVMAGGLPVAAGMLWLVPEPGADRVSAVPVSVAPTAARARRLRSFPLLGLAASVLGWAAVGFPILGTAVLRQRWAFHLGARDHVWFVAGLGLFAGLPMGGVLGDRAWSRGVGARGDYLARGLGWALGAFGFFAGIAALGVPPWVAEGAWVLALAALGASTILTAQAIASVSLMAVRALAFGLIGIYGLVLGGFGATVVLEAVAHANDARAAMGLAGAVTIVAGALVRRGGAALAADVEAIEAEEASLADDSPTRRGGRAALSVRGVDFSYEARQVLFGVSFDVTDGEVAALLGTNGAGKSTVLRLIAGLDHPTSGTIRLAGQDTTFLEAEQVLGLGAALLSGGRMTFPSLTVIENLRIGCHSIRRQGARSRQAIGEALELFPVLAQRRNQRAGTLSGGEQQMLALARLLLTQPRLLLIDELSLGLAPRVIEGLLEIVRRVNQRGATVLLVEQSIDLALSIAEHALFLERGEVRFDGPTAELARRQDLLRPVFLESG